MAANDNKLVSKKLQTFLSWKKEDIIGYETKMINGENLVIKIWCKLCAKHKQAILNDPSIKGSIKKSMVAFTVGTCVVTKGQVYSNKFLIKLQAMESYGQNKIGATEF